LYQYLVTQAAQNRVENNMRFYRPAIPILTCMILPIHVQIACCIDDLRSVQTRDNLLLRNDN